MPRLLLKEIPGIDENDQASKHVILKIIYGYIYIGNVAIKEESILEIEAGEQVTVLLKFDFCTTENMYSIIIEKVLFFIREKIENIHLFFEKIIIEPKNADMEIAALKNGFTKNGGKNLILFRENNREKINSPIETEPQKKTKYKSKIPVSKSSQIKILQILLNYNSEILQSEISNITKLGLATIRAATNEFYKIGLIKRRRHGRNAYLIIPEIDKINKKLEEFGAIPIIPVPTIDNTTSPAANQTTKPPIQNKPINTIKTNSDPTIPDKLKETTLPINPPATKIQTTAKQLTPLEKLINILLNHVALGKKGIEERELQEIASKTLTPDEIYYAKKHLKTAGILSAWKGSSYLTINPEKLQEKLKEY